MGLGIASANQKGVGMKYQPDQLSLAMKPSLPTPPAPKPKKKISSAVKWALIRAEREKKIRLQIAILMAKVAGSASKSEKKSWVEHVKSNFNANSFALTA